ncbi:hypothetical protein PFDG_05167 [Plasmodium falciparum Dd2]|uniref:Uncharacterized protein n=1 Tax=Plasmodium falciparum (isolate Dd2) TaxID=57267 RepID=A0A0L7M9T2_PLAF4|nr:hypothetical protein PFDG_05167 [Plasmodium falciparum Dd2]
MRKIKNIQTTINKNRNISQSTSFLNNKIIYDDYRNLIFNTSDTYNHNVSKSINIISHDINDILYTISAREENYFTNQSKDIIYTSYESEENETSKKRNHFMYVSPFLKRCNELCKFLYL